MTEKYPEIIIEVKKRLSQKRFDHTCRVRDAALQIGEQWLRNGETQNLDCELLELAALLHDVAKEDDDLLKNRALHLEFRWGKELLDQANLIHAAAGAFVAEMEFGIKESSALIAIAYHPTGHPKLDALGHALYLADYCEPGRPFLTAKEHKKLMNRAISDRHGALLEVVQRKKDRVLEKGRQPHPLSSVFEESLYAHVSRRSAAAG